MYYLILCITNLQNYIQKIYGKDKWKLRDIFGSLFSKDDYASEYSESTFEIINQFKLQLSDFNKRWIDNDYKDEICQIELQSLLAFYQSVLELIYKGDDKLVPDSISLPFFANEFNFNSLTKLYGQCVLRDVVTEKIDTYYPHLFRVTNLYLPVFMKEPIRLDIHSIKEGIMIGSSTELLNEFDAINHLFENNGIDIDYDNLTSDIDFIDKLDDSDRFTPMKEFIHIFYQFVKYSIEEEMPLSYSRIVYSK